VAAAGEPGRRDGRPRPEVAELSYAEAGVELDGIIEEFETGVVDVDRLVEQLERATDIVDELDRRLRRTRLQVEELVPRLEAIGRRQGPEGPAGDDPGAGRSTDTIGDGIEAGPDDAGPDDTEDGPDLSADSEGEPRGLF